ncbi:MAG: hypothetical protein QXI89_02170 [Candidatus Anstonellales archaeon]
MQKFVYLIFILLLFGCISQQYIIEQHIKENEAVVNVKKSIDYSLYENNARKMPNFASEETQLELWLLRQGIALAECSYLNENNISCVVKSSGIEYNFTTREGFNFNKETDWILGNETAIIKISKLKQPIIRNDTRYIEIIKNVIKEDYKGQLPSDLDGFIKSRIDSVNKTYIVPSTTLLNFEQNALLATKAQAIDTSYIKYKIIVDGYEIKSVKAGNKILNNTFSFDELKTINEPITIIATRQLYPAYTPVLLILIILTFIIYKITRKKKRKIKKGIDDLVND